MGNVSIFNTTQTLLLQYIMRHVIKSSRLPLHFTDEESGYKANAHTYSSHLLHTHSIHAHSLPSLIFLSRAILAESPTGTLQGSKKQTMLSFKQFLTQQDDSIDETDAIQKYNEYKREFKQRQIVEFFDEHKEEDW